MFPESSSKQISVLEFVCNFLNSTCFDNTTASDILSSFTFSTNDQLNDLLSKLLFESTFTSEELKEFFGKPIKILKKIYSCTAAEIQYIQFPRAEDVPVIPNVTKYMLTILLTLCFVFSIIGNTMCIYVLTPFKRIFSKIFPKTLLVWKKASQRKLKTMRKYSSSNANATTQYEQTKMSQVSDVYFIVTSIMDLFFTTTIIPFHIGTILSNGFWIFGYNTCKTQTFYGQLVLCLTSLLLITISIERYLSIVKQKSQNSNQKPKFSCCILSQQFKLKGILIILLIFWIVSIAIASPYLIYNFHLPVIKGVNCLYLTDEYMCVNLWPASTTSHIYKTCYWFFMFIIPGLILLYSYCSISWSLFVRTTTKLKSSTFNCWRIKSKRRIIVILICDSLFYIICWFPFSIWSMQVSLNSLMKISMNSTFQKDIIKFCQLVSIALINVSLKWVFRMIALWPRLREKNFFNKIFFSKRKVMPKLMTAEPYIIGNRQKEILHADCKKRVEFLAENIKLITSPKNNNNCKITPLLIFVQPTKLSNSNDLNLTESRSLNENDIHSNRDSFTKTTYIASSIRRGSKSVSDVKKNSKY